MHSFVFYFLHCKADNIYFYNVVIGLKGEKEKSSHYGLYVLGFTCATRAKTMRHKREILSKSLKIAKVRIKE